tara:strand:+ start:1216 stop:2505 length:1290 start_codon:yes stop_codon:yes gene_type:complete
MRKLCFVFYRFLLYFLLPFALLRLVIRAKGDLSALAKLSERFGFYHDIAVSGSVIWVHAVSVGESIAASVMIRQLRQDLPAYKILFSVTTASARARAKAIFADQKDVTIIYFPYDIMFAITRLLVKFDVAMVVVMETEIWPNLYTKLSQENIPLLLANARLSAKSCKKYAKFRNFFAGVFASVSHIAAQDKSDFKRFIFMGANPSNIKILGSMKYDIKPPTKTRPDLSSGMLSYFAAAQTFMAISTHENEEEIILAAFVAIKNSFPNAKLILVPRHPARVADIIKLINGSGFKYILYSAGSRCDIVGDILLVDKIGVLAALFQVFDVAYVGGSLIDRGGQNPIEPAFYARPVLMGPSRYNFHQVARGMSKTGGLLLVTDATDMASEVVRLFSDTELSNDLGRRLLEHVTSQAGSTMRHVELIKELLCIN